MEMIIYQQIFILAVTTRINSYFKLDITVHDAVSNVSDMYSEGTRNPHSLLSERVAQKLDFDGGADAFV